MKPKNGAWQIRWRPPFVWGGIEKVENYLNKGFNWALALLFVYICYSKKKIWRLQFRRLLHSALNRVLIEDLSPLSPWRYFVKPEVKNMREDYEELHRVAEGFFQLAAVLTSIEGVETQYDVSQSIVVGNLQVWARGAAVCERFVSLNIFSVDESLDMKLWTWMFPMWTWGP